MIQMKILIVMAALLLSVCEVFPDGQILTAPARLLCNVSRPLAHQSADMEAIEGTTEEVSEEAQTASGDSELALLMDTIHEDVVQLIGAVIKLLAVVMVLLLILIGAVTGYFIVHGLPKG